MTYDNLFSKLAVVCLALSVFTQPLCYARPERSAPLQDSPNSRVKRSKTDDGPAAPTCTYFRVISDPGRYRPGLPLASFYTSEPYLSVDLAMPDNGYWKLPEIERFQKTVPYFCILIGD